MGRLSSGGAPLKGAEVQHDIEHPWATGEQLVGESIEDIFDRIEEKHERINPVIDPGSFAAPESTLNRQFTAADRQVLGGGPDFGSGRPGGHAGYGR
jgi:hypothetical protein